MIEFNMSAGLEDCRIDYHSCAVPVHRDLVAHLQRLQAQAADAGFELALASGYRSFDRQRAIWNAKAEGRRPLLDDNGEPLNVLELSAQERLFAILRWSALPGASRHHWGTDIDVYDGKACRGYQLQLTHAETQPGGVFADFHRWLDRELADAENIFFRPYRQWSGGVAPEPWHLSCAPLASEYQRCLDKSQLRQLLSDTDIALKEEILANFDEIFERFVWVDWQLYPAPDNSVETSNKL